MKTNIFLFLYAVLLQIIDICITMFAISGAGIELNTTMSFYMNIFGNLQWLIICKGTLLALIFVGVIKNVRHIRLGLYLVCCYYTIALFFIMLIGIN